MSENTKNTQTSKNKITIIIVLVVMVLLIGGGTILYKIVLPKYENKALQSNQSQERELMKAPDFYVYNRKDKKVNLSDFKGKPIVLNFWASWCTPCKYEMPFFQEVYEKYGKDVEVMMVNLNGGGNDKRINADAFILEGGYKFPVYYDTDSDAAIKYGITAMPVTFILNEKGEIVTGRKGAITREFLFNEVEKLLK